LNKLGCCLWWVVNRWISAKLKINLDVSPDLRGYPAPAGFFYGFRR
jgi:hypothetical protein